MATATRASNVRASDHVREDRLWQRHVEMAKQGPPPRGGANRQGLSAEDAAARATLAGWAAKRGYEVFTDPIGNLFVRRAGTDPAAKPILSGSHLDSQPTGGKYDGTYGVLAAFEALEALDDGGIATRRPVVAVAWTNEEGNRFQPGCMGSGTWAGVYRLDDMLAKRGTDGPSVGEALETTLRTAPARRVERVGFAIDGYVEAHIEQGPILERTANEIGVVTLIQGNRRFIVEVTGEEAHSGTTPNAARKDAMKAAASIVLALWKHFEDPTDTIRYTIGRFEVFPGSPSVVPGRVSFMIDFRHPDQATLTRLGDGVAAICEREARARGCTVAVDNYVSVAPTPFKPEPIALVRDAAQALGMKHMDMISGA